MTLMRGASRGSFEAARREFDTNLVGADPQLVSSDLFSLSRVLDGSAALRRALTDPSRDTESKVELATSLFGTKVSPATLAVVRSLVGGRWSRPSTLTDAIELLAIEAEAANADSRGTLDAVESELFHFARLVEQQSALRQALTDRSVDFERKQALLASLLTNKVDPSTLKLISALVASLRGRSVERGLAEFAEVVANRRGRSIAHVTTAVALSSDQQLRLASALASQTGRPIQINVEVDPSIVGGISVRLGDELLDGTIINRMADARRRMAG
jgi:F-type H+-transporting ATPase subunit delta